MSADDREGLLRFGSQSLAVKYPPVLRSWLDRRTDPRDPSWRGPWIDIGSSTPDRFTVSTNGGEPVPDLELGNTLGLLWERATFLLIERMEDAFALHCAVVVLGRTLVVIAGSTGAGKTHLALWLCTKGARLLTDEAACFAAGESAMGPVLVGALRRPVFLKGVTDAAPLVVDTPPPTQVHSDYGLIVDVESGSEAAEYDDVVVIFPRFEPRGHLDISLLTPGETAMHLMGNCLNVRNLPRGGLPVAAELARQVVALRLEYGATAEIEGFFDTLVRIATRLEPAELAAICAGFSRSDRTAEVSASSTAVPREFPPATAKRFQRRLTVGMATYDDYDGTYFTIQALRLTHPELCDEIEFVVIDNNPGGACSEALANLESWVSGYRYVPVANRRGTAVRDALFGEASSPVVLCVDAHILIDPRGIPALLAHFEADPQSRDLVQGPLVYDNLKDISTHWEPAWRGGMYGTWATDDRGLDPSAPAFEIPMVGLGLFACRREAWPGFNAAFRGFGGEEGYIHEKFRRRGGRTLCLPALRWVHRFARPMGLPYVNKWDDRIRNYFIGFTELGWDTHPIVEHFATILDRTTLTRIVSEIQQELGHADRPQQAEQA